jgi:hypothetical protein
LLIDKSNSEQLGKNLVATGEAKPAPGYEAHHLVPSDAGGPGMQELRLRLQGLGIDLNDAANGVWLPGPKAPADAQEAYHRRLNNTKYNNAVEEALRDVTNKQQAEDTLQRIKTQLQRNNFPGVRPRP